MKNKKRFIGILGLHFFCFGVLQAQENEKDDIGTQEVLVVKSYTPSLSDAFKINSTPQIPDSLKMPNKLLDFKIKSVPVVSTFVPNKATPLKLERRSTPSPYNTLFSSGFGNKNQLFFDVSSVIEWDRSQRFGIKLYRDGFGSDVTNSILRSNQSFTSYGVHHNLRSNSYNAHTLVQFNSQKNNYFGLYDREWDPLLIRTINPEISRNYFKIKTFWNWYDLAVRGIDFQANLTSDNFSTTEQKLALKTDFALDFGSSKITSELNLRGLKTSFEEAYFKDGIRDFSQGIGSFSALLENNKNNFKFKIGAGIAYVLGVEDYVNRLIYYPEVEMTYKNSSSVMIPFLEAKGGVKFNSYQKLALENPYLAPVSNLIPTLQKYNATVGVRSQLASVLNFDFGFVFDEVENFSFFERLPFDSQNKDQPYRLSNAFQSEYSDLSLYGVKAKFRIDLTKNNYLHFETSYRYYEVNDGQTLWNIPSLKMSWDGQFQLKDRLTFSFQGSLLGDRKVAFRPIFIYQQLETVQFQEERLPMFISSHFHLAYNLSNQFDLFIKTKLNSNGTHGRWYFFKEPPFIGLAGVTYKFDFQY
ncbi:MAG: hypothetical protein VW080_07885 [Flavobacteriaceae bacterium]